MINVLVCVIESLYIGKTKGKGTFGKVKQGTHDPTNEKVKSLISDHHMLFILRRYRISKNLC